MYRGVDITEIDILNNNDNGYRDTIFDTMCETDVVQKIGDIEYQKPLEIGDFSPRSKGEFGDQVQIHESLDDIKSSMSTSVGLGVESGRFSFSASATYKEDKESLEDQKKSLAVKDGRFITYVAQFKRIKKIDLAEDLLLDFEELPAKFAEDPDDYFKFIKKYGTHYFEKA